MGDSDLMERAEVMDYLRISRGTLDKLQKRREFPFAKIGKKVLFRKRDIDAWLESKVIKARVKA
jgi:excisionase family DNA binding protein